MEGVTWVEVLDGHGGVTARARLDRLPFLIGRGYGGDLVVDDPQICAAHVRVAADADGTVTAEDLDSVNGLWTASGNGWPPRRRNRAPRTLCMERSVRPTPR